MRNRHTRTKLGPPAAKVAKRSAHRNVPETLPNSDVSPVHKSGGREIGTNEIWAGRRLYQTGTFAVATVTKFCDPRNKKVCHRECRLLPRLCLARAPTLPLCTRARCSRRARRARCSRVAHARVRRVAAHARDQRACVPPLPRPRHCLSSATASPRARHAHATSLLA